jgi:heme-degrading monooxygenase HmoA
MISRVWHGWTTYENADAYEGLLREEIFKWIESKEIAGYEGIQLLQRELADEVEFVTIMWFDDLDAVRQFAGEDYETAVVPPEAQQLLSHYDAVSAHYEVRKDLSG